MKKDKLFFVFFIGVWVILILANFLKPNRDFSEKENRKLAGVPRIHFDTLVSGEYSERLDTYINDHFVFRDGWLSIKSMLELVQGKKENNEVYIGKDGYLFEKEWLDEKKISNLVIEARQIEKFALKQNIPVYSIIVPTSIYVNQDKLPDNVSSYPQVELIKKMQEYMPSVTSINVIDTILEHKNEYLYYRTDHHMTNEAAYLIYQEYAKALDLSIEESYQKKIVTEEFLGTFDSKAQIPWQKKDTMIAYETKENMDLEEVWYDGKEADSLYNPDYLKQKDKYSYFLDGNHAVTVIKTKVKNGKKLLMIKDSYAHVMPQFLCSQYEEIHLLDLRYYKLPTTEYIEKNGITEVVFFYNISNLLTDIGLRNLK